MNGLLTGFLFPITPILLFRDLPLPNFFDADAEAASGGTDAVGSGVAATSGIGGESIPNVVFGQRMQVSLIVLIKRMIVTGLMADGDRVGLDDQCCVWLSQLLELDAMRFIEKSYTVYASSMMSARARSLCPARSVIGKLLHS